MSKHDILHKLTDAIVEIEDEQVMELVEAALKAGIPPMDIVTGGLQPGLTIIGEGFDKHTRFTSDLILAGEILNDVMDKLRPIMVKSAGGTGDTMIIGTVEGDEHSVGKRVVGAMFTGAGFNVIDIGENQSASAFVKAAKEHKAKVVGASAILGPQKPYCKVIHEALVDAGLRDNLIFIVGGWGMTQEWCDNVCADAYGDTANEAIDKVKKIMVGELPRKHYKSAEHKKG